MILLALALSAQQPPRVRPIGPIEHVTAESLAAVSQVVATSGGRVLLNDMVAQRVLLYDSAFTHGAVVVDSSSSGPNAYGDGPASLIRYRGDSALLVSTTTSSMLVLGPDGTIARTMAMPPQGAFSNLFDGHGHLLYLVQARAAPGASASPLRAEAGVSSGQPPPRLDSAFVVRFDLVGRTVDTVTTLRGPPFQVAFNRNESGRIVSITTTVHPMPTVDDWNLLADGTVAVVRGRDYHVDWFGPDRVRRSSPRMTFAWEQLNDEQRRVVTDSAVAALQHSVDSARDDMAGKMAQSVRGGRGDQATVRQLVVGVDPSKLPDYRPPLRYGGSVRGDADGNLWIQTTRSFEGRPVYDIVNRDGEVTDHVVLPRNRRIAGFGPGVIYMSVLDSLKVAHLERARIR